MVESAPEPEATPAGAPTHAVPATHDLAERVGRLEQQVADLQEQIRRLEENS